MKCKVCNSTIDDDSCFCKWCGSPVEEIPWIEEDGIEYTERIPFYTFWREHGEMTVYKKVINENTCSCILFTGQDGNNTIVNFNMWEGAATFLEIQACKRHMLVYHLSDGSYEAHGYQTDEHRDHIPVTPDSLIIETPADYDNLPF
jgi:hypothetical protein